MQKRQPIIAQPTPENLAKAAETLRNGGLVAFPTETVYGLGADATNRDAVARVYAAKGRPAHNPLIVHIADSVAAESLALIDERTRAVMAQFWPGPLTLVLPHRPDSPITDMARAGLNTIALRCPNHATARQLIALTGRPLVGPSANPSGRLSPTTPLHVADGLGEAVAMILSGGQCDIGVESSVLDLTTNQAVLLRPGAINAVMLAPLLGDVRQSIGNPDQPSAPGQLLRHYAPRLPLRLNARDVAADEAFLNFGPNPFAPKGGVMRRNLSEAGDWEEAAHNLFAMLADLETSGARAIAVAPLPDTQDYGIADALRDRLTRAAAASHHE
jgi:L-threonylcarbamoyladenylate synthase